MPTNDWLRALAARKLLIINCLALGLVVAGLINFFQPKLYEAEAEVYVVATGRQLTSTDMLRGAQLVDARMPTYAQLTTTTSVLNPVINDLALPMGPTQLASRLTVRHAAGSATLSLRARDPSPAQAQAITQAVLEQLIMTVARLETSAQSSPMVAVRFVSDAEINPNPVFPRRWLNLAIGFAAGLLVALAAVTVTVVSYRLERGRAQAAQGDRDEGAAPEAAPFGPAAGLRSGGSLALVGDASRSTDRPAATVHSLELRRSGLSTGDAPRSAGS